MLANLAAAYQKLGLNDRYFETLKRASRSGGKDPAIYLNLGNEFVNRRDTAAGIELIKRALEIDPALPEAHANLALLSMRRKNYQLAALHSSRAIELGMHEPVIYKCAAYSHFGINDASKALEYFDMYLSMAPADNSAQRVRDELRQRMGRTGGAKR